MAYLRRRSQGRVEIRESISTPAGPRARTLCTFRGSLGPDSLERARARARRPFDEAALSASAHRLGISVTARRRGGAARRLLARLRQGVAVDPVLVTLLREALTAAPSAPVPDDLREVAEWIGAEADQRGEALRGLLRTTDRLVRGRPTRRARERDVFPRFCSAALAREGSAADPAAA